jgi:predicted AlkP superfamily phosphohydrolase/phosphomutase
MKHRYCRLAATLSVFLVLASSVLSGVGAQEPVKAIVLAWDGAVPAFVHEMLGLGKLPNLDKLIRGGAFADDVTPVFPSLTASGFASLWTGAPPRITGISGNRVPRLPPSQFTILESSAGFNNALLQAEPLWASAGRAGRKLVVVHVPLGGDKSEHGVHFQGYRGIAGREGIVNSRTSKPRPARSWQNLPVSAIPALEITFKIAASTLHGLLIDDPSDPQQGYDTLLVASTPDGTEVQTQQKPRPGGPGGEAFWSQPIHVKTNDGQDATTYLRLFDLKPDASDFLLLFTRPTREIVSSPELLMGVNSSIRAFIGNGAHSLYNRGILGRTLPNGGDGTAEARYLETISFAQRQLTETSRWALEHLPWDLFVAYTPFPDEAEHAWRGFLEPSLPGFRSDVADRLRPFLQEVYRLSDEMLGRLMTHRTENTVVALISDHGMEGAHKLVAINKVLQENGLLVTDQQGRVDLGKTKAIYPAMNNGYLLINSTDRKGGIVAPEERNHVAQRLRELLLGIHDGDRQVVTAVVDAQTDGVSRGIGGEAGGDLYLDFLPGYEPDPRLGALALIAEREPHGMHGFNPQKASMRTLMVFNGPGVSAGQRLRDVALIDFAPTLAELLDIPVPKNATGRVLAEVFAVPR